MRPWLGLAAQAVSFDKAKAQGLSRPLGVMVTEVGDDGPADRAGLRRGDLITAIDGREVFDEKGLKFLAAIRNPGDSAQLNVLRGGKNQVIAVRVAPPPGATEADIVALDGRSVFSGARVVELSPRLAEENGLDPSTAPGSGIYVYSVARRSIAGAYFRPGDIIRSVNGVPMKSVKDLKTVIQATDNTWDIEIDHNGRTVRGTDPPLVDHADLCSTTGRLVITATKSTDAPGSPTTSTFSNRFKISSHRMRSCISATRLPMQRWMPKPKETWRRAFGRSIRNSSARSITSSSLGGCLEIYT
ncbi:MAG: PDZ domain-containing protein [Hyphomonas sp.]